VDIFHCSTRRYWEKEFENSPVVGHLNLSGWTKKITGKPVITVGSVGLNTSFVGAEHGMEMSAKAGIEASSITQLAERLDNKEFDLVAVGRALIQDPTWAIKVRDNRLDELQDYSKDSLMQLV
jgi:2,4-dienoyl-CoA reductase-like NADH-dependent reductase (Old Yellow Enzyme family)